MFKLSHLRMAIKILDELEPEYKELISKGMFCIGSILPDINAVCPPHVLSYTRKRFVRKLRNYQCGGFNKSLILGVIIHYLCDYFCFTHNIRCSIKEHIQYESNLQSHVVVLLRNEFDEYKKGIHESLQSYWEVAMVEAAKDVGINIKCSVTCKLHIKFLMRLLDLIHDNYLSKLKEIQNEGINPFESVEQMELDLEYAVFISKMFIRLMNKALILEY